MGVEERVVLTEATYYILLSLIRPRHGYGIMQRAEALSHGRVRLAAGTLYGALSAMCDRGWIIQLPAQEDSRRKEYQLTRAGLEALRGEMERLKELIASGEEARKEEG